MLAAGQRGVQCFTYTPQAIKLAVCGSGSAGKKQVGRMVGTLLGLPEPPASEHAADALAVAICHAGVSERTDEIKVSRTATQPTTPGSGAENVRGVGAAG
jgi:crossover junction endodeoxyribonuclease RuvC